EDKTADVRLVFPVTEPPNATGEAVTMNGEEQCAYLTRELVAGWSKVESKNIGTEDDVVCELSTQGANVAEVFDEEIRYEGEEIKLRLDLGVIAAVASAPTNPAADVPLRVTFPGAVTDSRLGKIEGNTVTFQHSEIWGEDSLIITARAKAERDLTWVYLLVGGAIFALDAVVAFVVYRESKKQKAKKAAQQAPAQPLPPQGAAYGYAPTQHQGYVPPASPAASGAAGTQRVFPVPGGQPQPLPGATYGQAAAQPPQSAPSGYAPPQHPGYVPPAPPQEN
ncbi:MAG: hypothetical protein Q3999_08610, partial [Buchananella hordeovulneris]|nr:hypothetical protein [Buchananella hordeovulneris]